MLLSWVAASLVFAGAAQKPVCDSMAVTRNCEFYKEQKDKPLIILPDGSKSENPAYEAPEKKPVPADDKYKEKIELAESDVQDAFGASPFSTRFKNQFSSFIYLTDPNAEVFLPWPPEQRDASKVSKKIGEVDSYLRKSMSSKDYETLQATITRVRKLYAPEFAEKRKKTELAVSEVRSKEADEMLRKKRWVLVQEMFKEAKQQLERTIARGKKESELSPEQRILIEKVKAVTLADQETVANDSTCKTESENAFYLPIGQTLVICPDSILASTGDIAFTLGHEIGHAVGPCRAAMPLWEVNEAAVGKIAKDSSLNDVDKAELTTFLGPQVKQLNFDLDTLFTNPNFVNRLVKSGAVKLVHHGIPLEKYPFKNEFDCMSNKNHFRRTRTEDIDSSLAYIQDKMKASPTNRVLLEKSATRYKEAMKKYPECFMTIGPQSKASEVMSDVFGTLNIESHLLEHPFRTEGEKVLAVTFAKVACESKEPELARKVLPPYQLEDQFRETDLRVRHPQSDARVQKIILNSPGMADLYDCRRTVPACFDHLSTYTQRAKKTSTNKTQRGRP